MFRNVELTGAEGGDPAPFLFIRSTGEAANLTINLHNNMTFVLAGDRSVLHVNRNTFSTAIGGITMLASPNGNLGRAVVTSSTLRGAAEVTIGASCESEPCTAGGPGDPSSRGVVLARGNRIETYQLYIVTGTMGRTAFIDNSVSTVLDAVIHAGEGGICHLQR